MRVYGTKEFNWKENKLYVGKEDTEYSVETVFVEDYHPQTYYRIRFPKGSCSEDFYNLTRAKDNCVKFVSSIYDRSTKKQPTELTGAFK